MLTITPAAAQFIRSRHKPIYLDIPPAITNCCFTIRESPSVRFGEPPAPEAYERRTVDGITVFVPHDLPDIPLTIAASRFFGLTRLAVEGWRLA